MVNATATRLNEVLPIFDLHAISIKPLAMPIDPVPFIANVTIRGWAADDEGMDGPLIFWVGWTAGYTKPLLVDFNSNHFSKSKWEGLKLLDFSVDFGPGHLDWEFCFDDLIIGFAKVRPEHMREKTVESERVGYM